MVKTRVYAYFGGVEEEEEKNEPEIKKRGEVADGSVEENTMEFLRW